MSNLPLGLSEKQKVINVAANSSSGIDHGQNSSQLPPSAPDFPPLVRSQSNFVLPQIKPLSGSELADILHEKYARPKISTPPPAPVLEKTEQDRKSRVPPVIVRDTAKWMLISSKMASSGIGYSKAKNCQDGIRVQPITSQDLRGLSKFLDQSKIPYYTFTLAEERTLQVVFRSIPVEVKPEEVMEDLRQKGFQPIKVSRITREKTPIPLLMMEVPHDKQ